MTPEMPTAGSSGAAGEVRSVCARPSVSTCHLPLVTWCCPYPQSGGKGKAEAHPGPRPLGVPHQATQVTLASLPGGKHSFSGGSSGHQPARQ